MKQQSANAKQGITDAVIRIARDANQFRDAQSVLNKWMLSHDLTILRSPYGDFAIGALNIEGAKGLNRIISRHATYAQALSEALRLIDVKKVTFDGT